MNVDLKIFPIAGVCDSSLEMKMTLIEGSLSELLSKVWEHLEVDAPASIDGLMLIQNGRVVDMRLDVRIEDDDRLWLMPQISGG